MITWIRDNAVLFSVATSAILCLSTVAVARYQLAGLVASQGVTNHHMNDTTRHLDPYRDTEAAKDLKEEIRDLKRRIEVLERRQIWLVNGIRQGATTSIPMLSGEPTASSGK